MDCKYKLFDNILKLGMTQVNPWTILTTSPFKIYGRQDNSQKFHEMLINSIAPYYRLKSLTTIIIYLPIIIYITLVVHYPPFLKVPAFASKPLQLRPQNLQHFQFYRLFTSPFVFTQLSSLILGCFIRWILGSYTEEFLGWRLLIVFCGFQGLIGYSYQLTLQCFLLGCNYAYMLMGWPAANNPVIYRKITLVLNLVIAFMFFLFFINFSKQQRYNSYLSAIYGVILTFMVGTDKDGANLPTYRKISLLACYIIFFAITTLLILNIVLYRITIV